MDDNKIYQAELKRALKLQRSVTFAESYGLCSPSRRLKIFSRLPSSDSDYKKFFAR